VAGWLAGKTEGLSPHSELVGAAALSSVVTCEQSKGWCETLVFAKIVAGEGRVVEGLAIALAS